MSIRFWRVAIYAGMQDRIDNGVNPTWLGFAYGRWTPGFDWGRQGAAWCLDWCWLCFHGSIYWNDKHDKR